MRKDNNHTKHIKFLQNANAYTGLDTGTYNYNENSILKK